MIAPFNPHPDIAIVTSMDPDHLDIYGECGGNGENLSAIAVQVKTGGWSFTGKVCPLPSDGRVVPYAIREASLISERIFASIRIDTLSPIRA